MHLCLLTEERWALSRRSLKVALNEERSAKEDHAGDVIIDQSIVKTKVKVPRGPPSAKISFKGARCAERDVSAMLLWQHEFYYVLEQEELSRRQLAYLKPYLYQALEFRYRMRRRIKGIVTKAVARNVGIRSGVWVCFYIVGK
jgi:hypothetical protein